jgi:epsilon-lactone hydrolase
MISDQAKSIHAAMARLRDQLAASGYQPTLAERRAGMEVMASAASEPAGVSVELVDAGGVPAMWLIPEGGAEDRAIQYVHGGGYVLGSMHLYRNLCGHLATQAGCRVLDVDYRLAPEHPHPAAVQDSTTAYRWLLDQGFQPEHLAISGDSAGGGLTMATLVAVRDAGAPLPAAAAPISPWVDLEGVGGSMATNAELDLIVQAAGLRDMAALFLDGGDPHDPLAAPLHADLSGLPPLYIQVGGHETLLDDSLRLAERARAAGVEVELEVFDEMQHVFQVYCGNVPEATDAVAKIGAWLRPRLGLPDRAYSA